MFLLVMFAFAYWTTEDVRKGALRAQRDIAESRKRFEERERLIREMQR